MPSPARSARRDVLLEKAQAVLEAEGPEGLQARRLTAELGTSTQAVYTLFGGMPGLFEAMVVGGFSRFGEHVGSVPESDDPVADHFVKGAVYCDWALAHPQLYRLMFGLTGGGLRLHAGLEMTLAGTLANFPEGRAAADVLVRSVQRVRSVGRIRAVDPVAAAGQFLSATHGYVLLEMGGVFGNPGEGLQMMGALAVNLMVGLGDRRDAAERSLAAALERRTA